MQEGGRSSSHLWLWEDIGAMLGTYAKTVQRIAKEWNITSFSHISDSDLDYAVSSIIAEFPCTGEVMLKGPLQCMYRERGSDLLLGESLGRRDVSIHPYTVEHTLFQVLMP